MSGYQITRATVFGQSTKDETRTVATLDDVHHLADIVGDMSPFLDRERCEIVAERLRLWKWAPEQTANYNATPIAEEGDR